MFEPGVSGNPAGRPKKAHSITQMLRDAGDAIVDPETGQTRAQRLAETLWGMAEDGDRDIAKYIIDRQDGKPKERVEHSESKVLRVTLDDGTGTPEAEAVHSQ